MGPGAASSWEHNYMPHARWLPTTIETHSRTYCAPTLDLFQEINVVGGGRGLVEIFYLRADANAPTPQGGAPGG